MPTLHWVGKDKVVNHHHDVSFRLLDKQYTFTGNEGWVYNDAVNDPKIKSITFKRIPRDITRF